MSDGVDYKVFHPGVGRLVTVQEHDAIQRAMNTPERVEADYEAAVAARVEKAEREAEKQSRPVMVKPTKQEVKTKREQFEGEQIENVMSTLGQGGWKLGDKGSDDHSWYLTAPNGARYQLWPLKMWWNRIGAKGQGRGVEALEKDANDSRRSDGAAQGN